MLLLSGLLGKAAVVRGFEGSWIPRGHQRPGSLASPFAGSTRRWRSSGQSLAPGLPRRRDRRGRVRGFSWEHRSWTAAPGEAGGGVGAVERPHVKHPCCVFKSLSPEMTLPWGIIEQLMSAASRFLQEQTYVPAFPRGCSN